MTVSLKDVQINRDHAVAKEGLRSGDYIEIQVADNGSGMTPKTLGSIFDPYFTTKPAGEGTGMGLSVVHGIVESYGGKITVESTLGKGTLFAIYLPITKKRQLDRTYESENLPIGKEHILLVDDEPAIAKVSAQILERLGYTVTTQTSSLEALELFRSRSQDFDLIITDMTMPNMTGDILASELIKLRPRIPVILCTGYSKKIPDEQIQEKAINAIAYKPIIKSELAKTVRKVLDEAI